MLDQKKILILTSKTGGGHVSLAEAIRDLLDSDVQATDGRCENGSKDPTFPAITIVDPQPGFFSRHYRIVSRYALWLWAAEFQFFDTPGRALLAHRVFARLLRHRLHALLDDVRPDLILTTYPFLTYEVMQVMEQRPAAVPLAMLFSDADNVHAAWLTERRAQATFATTRETFEQALAVGFDPQRLHLVGWPVRAQFSRACQASQETHREKRIQLGLDPDRFTVFLQGGSEGVARVNRTIENILAMSAFKNATMQVIMATGTNASLLEHYQHVPGLALLPHTKDIAPYMAATDVIMGKAGPNMLFESVMLGKPFIATTFIPGQEQANLAFIQRHGLGWVAIQPEEQHALLTALVHDPDQLKAMSVTIDAYRQWNAEANKRVVPLIRLLVEP